MKKFLSLIAVVFCTVLLTGCGGEKKLTCTKTETSSGITMGEKIEMNFKSDKVTTMSLTMTIEIPESLKTQAQTLVNSAESYVKSTYGSSDAITIKSEKKSDLKYDIIVSIDYKNMSDSDKTKFGFSGDESYEVNKQDLEKSGYTCK